MARQYDQQTSEGDHPFADDGVDVPQEQAVDSDTPGRETANPFSSSSQGPLYATAPEYETSYSGRGGRVLALGIVGVLVFAFPTTIFMVWWTDLFPYWYPPLLIPSLAFTIAAWQWGRRDLIAMRAGVMQTESKGLTRVGMTLGAVMTILVAVIVLGWAGYWLNVWLRAAW